MDVLTIQGLKKAYGKQQVLNGVDLRVAPHCIYGFIGQNGAGKTTTMKAILGLHTFDEGKILIEGEAVVFGKGKTNAYVGYVNDVPEFYTTLTPLDYLRLCGRISGMKKEELEQRIQELLILVGLEGVQKKRCGGFSRGMKQRLAIAQALLHKPKLLLADEPTSALDPAGRREILNILQQVKQETTVIFSTHILRDVEEICDDIAILHQGKIVVSGNLNELLQKHAQEVLVVQCARQKDAAVIQQHLQEEGLMCTCANQCITITHAPMNSMQMALMKILVKEQLNIEEMHIQKPSLEQLFMEVIA